MDAAHEKRKQAGVSAVMAGVPACFVLFLLSGAWFMPLSLKPFLPCGMYIHGRTAVLPEAAWSC